MQYKADFVTGVLSIIIFNTINLSLIGILIYQFNELNGWNIWHLIFLYGLWLLSHSIFSFFFWHLCDMENYLIQGTFDQFLTRPVSPLLQFLGRDVHYLGVGDILIGVTCIVISYINLGLDWTLINFMFFIIAVISGTIIEFSISWIIACISFWTGRSFGAFTILWQINSIVQQYPIDIFGNWFRIMVTFVLPVALMNYYPSLILLDKSDNTVYMLLSPLVSLLILGVAAAFWKKGIRSYSSSGN